MSSTNTEFTHTYTGDRLGGDKDNHNYDVKTVRIDSNITTIQKIAFWYCVNLTSIEIPDTITSIGYAAFSQCHSLTTITIPSSVKTIADGAFSYCKILKTVNISASTEIGQFAFTYCPKLDEQSKQRIYKLYNKTPTLDINFQQGKGARHGFQGATQKGYGAEMWGLTLQQIKYITNHPLIEEYTTMRQVVEIAVKPATSGLGISYALLVNQEQPLRAKVMVSVSTFTTINYFVLHSASRPFTYTIHLLLLLLLFISPTYSMLGKSPSLNSFIVLKALVRRARSGFVPSRFIRIRVMMISQQLLTNLGLILSSVPFQLY